MEDRRSRLSSTTFARALSIAGHPFLLIPLTIAATTRSWKWAGVVAAGLFLPLTVIVMRNVRRGTWSDADVSRHDQRAGLYFVAAPLLLACALTLHFLGANSRLLRGFAAGAVMLAIGLACNRWLKISMHMMSAGFCAVLIARLYPMSTAFVATFLLAIAWSRWKLQRHTLVEIAVGLALGVGAGFFA